MAHTPGPFDLQQPQRSSSLLPFITCLASHLLLLVFPLLSSSPPAPLLLSSRQPRSPRRNPSWFLRAIFRFVVIHIHIHAIGTHIHTHIFLSRVRLAPPHVCPQAATDRISFDALARDPAMCATSATARLPEGMTATVLDSGAGIWRKTVGDTQGRPLPPPTPRLVSARRDPPQPKPVKPLGMSRRWPPGADPHPAATGRRRRRAPSHCPGRAGSP